MPETIATRRLGPGDVALMREMNALFAQAFEDDETYAVAPPDDGYIRDRLAKAHIIVLAALDGEAVTGGLVAYELDKFEQARSEIYIYDLAVAQPYRRRGVATALIRAAQAIAAGRGAWVAFVQGDYGDEPALALYDKLGVREAVLHFDLPIVAGARA